MKKPFTSRWISGRGPVTSLPRQPMEVGRAPSVPPVFQRRVQLRISLRASTLCSYWQISSLYAARNASPLQIVIKADVTPRRSSTIGFTGPGCFTSSRNSTTCINRKGGGGYMKIHIYNERWWTTEPSFGSERIRWRFFFFLKRSSKTRMELYKSDTFIGGISIVISNIE